MSPVHGEMVLCSRRRDLPDQWLPERGFYKLTEGQFWEALGRLEPVWCLRSTAETETSLKQWIPYVLIRSREGRLAVYPRRGGEARLHGSWSLGVGGHINPTDDSKPAGDAAGWGQLFWNGLRRELREEFPGVAETDARFLGLIHESVSEVGRVHIGAVFLCEIENETLCHGSELDGLCWVSEGEIGGVEWAYERFEIWSQLSLSLLMSGLSD